MTPSDKPQGSDPQQEDPASVMTQAVDDSTTATSAEQQRSDGGAAADAEQRPSESRGGESSEGTEAPPPWQRGSATSTASASSDPADETTARDSAPDSGAEDTQTIRPLQEDPEGEATESASPGRSTVSFGAESRAGATSARRPSRGPRRASLQVRRVDPWSVLKLSLVLSVAMFFAWMIAVAVLYGVLGGMGVWEQLNGTFSDLTQPENSLGEPLISPARVFGVASIIGAVNIVLLTALATVASFIYNVAADFAGGVEVTLSERD
ncbi:hypothetical protein FHX42_005145 [Saccharopolyspora lacisalsi]|uniref:DUF3566 domain-containing protein n=1 Tax=Halosaccharopolyspora lacisalsi TaxID=1000566 RepID=A0A839E3W9_9PSEU|nr:DUF3566 domain-containing protein [Halosaccharopolyspora lacisalsi]MBA8827740.1 hypothetical protein [Halosaccharopolyspora lacisalsi]